MAEKPVTGRGDRVLPGVFRLRVPLPYPGVPHGNAWAVRSGDGLVLIDSGYSDADSMRNLGHALEQVGHSVDEVSLVVCTHAHADHCGNAATIAERNGCEVWMHPAREHMTLRETDPDAALDRRRQVALNAGVPPESLERWLAAYAAHPTGIAGPLRIDRELVPGVVVDTDLGALEVIETPGHAPSHVCLFAPDRRILFSGDHVLGRVSLFFEHGFSPDPVGEYLEALDRVDALDARLVLAGHARPFTDVAGHVRGHREAAQGGVEHVYGLLAEHGSLTPYEMARAIGGEQFNDKTAAWIMSQVLCNVEHLERIGRVENLDTTVSRFGIVA